jgi:putative ABC transport system substrate-binding protein
VNANRARIGNSALRARLPVISSFREISDAGGLVSYGAHYEDLFRRAGDYVDKVLRGTKPGDIPVEQPVKFETVFNLKTAKALGIEIPSRLLFTADEVIE